MSNSLDTSISFPGTDILSDSYYSILISFPVQKPLLSSDADISSAEASSETIHLDFFHIALHILLQRLQEPSRKLVVIIRHHPLDELH